MFDSIIIGNGPAGISAALYLLRAKRTVLIIGKDIGALEKAHIIENYYGLPAPISGAELHANGLKQAEALGAEFSSEEVLGLGYGSEGFIVQTKTQSLEAKTVLLATGAPRSKLNIKGLKELEGKGVSYCAICDAFFFRGKNVAVIGNAEFALHEIADLAPHASKITLLTNGKELKITPPENVEVIETAIESLAGEDRLNAVNFKDGTSLALDGVFLALGQAAASDLARKVGAMVDGNSIVVDTDMKTTVPSLFAAGDCIGGVLQISTAVGEGAKAGLSMIAQLRKT